MSLSYSQMSFQGDTNIGLNGFATDSYCIIGEKAEKKKGEISKILDIPVFVTSILHIDLAKIFICGNTKMLLVPRFLFDSDIKNLEKITKEIGIELIQIDTNKALGNLILMNDNGAIVSPLIKDVTHQLDEIGIVSKVETIAKLNVVGTRGICTNKGCLLGSDATEDEIKSIETTLKVSADIGTVGFGSPFPGAGIIANSHGFVSCPKTSGIELGKIAEALGFE
ncbi:MAG: translation initiation factor IF-6 [Candidatus Aenigmatarchaeota archaeon]